jgi:hypothetical protein
MLCAFTGSSQAVVIALVAASSVDGASVVAPMRLRGGAPPPKSKPFTRADWIKSCEGMKITDGTVSHRLSRLHILVTFRFPILLSSSCNKSHFFGGLSPL